MLSLLLSQFVAYLLVRGNTFEFEETGATRQILNKRHGISADGGYSILNLNKIDKTGV
jgi:hypothetical protein